MEEIPWKDRLEPARFMDTHSVELMGGPEEPQIRHLVDLLTTQGERGLAWPARLLFSFRDGLGKLMGWDDEKGEAPADPCSYFWQMSDEEREECVTQAGSLEGPARLLWNDEVTLCVEVLNATCQAFAVGYIRDRRAYLSVFVIETKWWSKYYLALIEPFRRYIVYPALVTWLEKTWADFYGDESKEPERGAL